MAKGSNNLSGRRSTSRNTKPYDANNSFVKKVATKVTDLIPQRSWISKWFNSSQNEEDLLEDNENPEEIESEEDSQKPPPLKRPCIRMDVTHPPGTFSIQPRAKSTINNVSPSKQQYSIHNETSDEDFSKPAMAGPSGMSHLVSSTPATQSDIRDITSQRSELNSLITTANNGTTNGMDDNSESSESTSGCSSLIPQTNRQEAPSNVSYNSPFSNRKRFNDDKLGFTNHMQSPRSLFLDNNVRDSLSSRRPSFNASIMTNTPDRASPLASPFYSGNVIFGGANAAGLYKRGRNLFNSSNEIQLKVPKRTCVEVKPSNTAGVDSSGMSQTAKKILEALEHFSSPITDAKKIPLKMMNSTSSVSKKRTRDETTSTTKVGLRHLTRELTVPTVPDILKLRWRQKLQDTTAAARKIVSARNEPPPPQEYHLRTQVDDDAKHHGKVKTKAKSANLEEEETVEPVNLPNIPLPISSLPNFNFMPPTNAKTVEKDEAKSEESSEEKMQVDSNKEPTNSKINTVISDVNKDDNITKLAHSKSNIQQDTSAMWECSECLFKNSNSETQCFACKATKSYLKDKKASELSSASSNSNELKKAVNDHFGSQFKLSSTQWECTSCFVRNKVTDTKCVACSTVKPDMKQETKSNAIKSTNSDLNNIKSLEKSWECSSCSLKNSENLIVCSSCNTPKSNLAKTGLQKNANIIDNVSASQNTNMSSNTSFSNANLTKDETMDKFKPSKDTWECPCCMVRNVISIDSCPCCNTAKPNAGVAAKSVPLLLANGFGDKFKKPEGAWNCDTCMVQNEATVAECVACGGSKPGSKKVDNSNVQLCFGTSPPASGFKFGIGKVSQEKVDSTIPTNGFKFGDSQQSSKAGQFTFGIQKEEKKTSEVQKPKSNVPSTSGGGFGFQINASSSEKTDVKQDSEKEEKKPTPVFSFGIPKTESGTIEGDKKSVNVTISTTVPATFTFGTAKPPIIQSDTKKEKRSPLLGNTATEISKPSTEATKSTATSTSTLSSLTQSNSQETKPTATFSFGVPSSTIAITSSTSTTVVSSLPSSTQSSFTFLEPKSTAQTAPVPTFDQITTSAPTSNLSNTFTFGDSKAKEGSSINKTFGSLPSAPSGSSLFSSISSTPSLFNNNDTKATPTFGQASTKDNTQTAFGAASTNKPSTFAVPENKIPTFGSTENKPSIFGSTDTKIPVFGSTENKTTSLFNPTPQTATATPTPTPFGAPSATPPTLFGSSVTPVFGNNTASTFTTPESTPNIFGSTSKTNESSTPNSNLFTFGTTPAQPVAKPGTGFNFSATTNPAESAQKPIFTFGSNATAPQSGNLFGNTFNNPTSNNSSGFTFNAPKPETPAFAQPTAPSPIFGAPSNTGFNFGSTTPATSSGGFNFGAAAPASTPSTGFNFNAPGTAPTFDPNTPPSFNFTGGNAPPTFNARPTLTQRKIKKAYRRMR